MDIFNEHIVKKAKGSKDYLLIAGMVIGGVLLTLLVFLLIMTFIPAAGSFVLLLEAGIVYLVYLGITSQNIEFEYILTNGELDLDRIVARRRRKRLLSVHSKNFEIFAPVSEAYQSERDSTSITKKVDASSGLNGANRYFAIFQKDNERYLLTFEPTEKMLVDFERFVPRSKFHKE